MSESNVAVANTGFRIPAIPKSMAVVAPAVLCALFIVYPMVDSTVFGLGRLELVFVYLMAAIALNFAFGYGGELAIGQPAMLTAAGYATGILSIHQGWGWLITTPIAVVVSIAVSVFMGLPSLRVRGWYLGVLGFLGVAIVPDVVNVFHTTTGGTDGLPGILPIEIGGEIAPIWFPYELLLFFTIVFWIAVRNLVTSGWGTSLRVYRDHPFAAVAAGVNPRRLRASLYILSGVPCGVAGALYANSQQFMSASNFGTQTVLLLLGAVMLGSRGTLWGPVIGTAIFSGISLWLGPFSLYNPLILAIGVLVSAVLFKGGIVTAIEKGWKRYGPDTGGTVRLLSTSDGGPPPTIAPIERPPHIDITGVSKHFAGNYAVQDVGLAVPGGSVVTVVGPNGSGKTTLLNCVSGFVTPDDGEVSLNGAEIAKVPAHRRAHLGLGRTFQVPRLVPEITVRENVELGVFGLEPQTIFGSIFRTPGFRRRRREAAARADEACRMLGLGDRAYVTKVEELPLAVKRLVEIARCLAADSSVICLDEPVAGLNESEQARVAGVLRAIAASGRSVLLIEHNLPFVLEVSDQLVLLRDGKVADRGVPADAQDLSRPLGTYFQTFATKADNIEAVEPEPKTTAS